jgi:predicted nucleic acid-binding protein
MIVCTDDKRARTVAKSLLGAHSVIGVLALLQKCVKTKLLLEDQAWAAYQQMLSRGAFLPVLDKSYFCQ